MKNLIFIVCLVLLSACKSKMTPEKRTALITLQEELKGEEIYFKAVAALPFQTQALNSVANDLLIRTGNSTSRINLNGSNYSLQILDNQAISNLPFYGEQRFSSGYNQNPSYTFNGDVKDFKEVINDKNGYLSYQFTTRKDSELLNIEFQIYSREHVQLHINSSHRTFMKYDGYLSDDKVVQEGEE